jgi:hypothetical protein
MFEFFQSSDAQPETQLCPLRIRLPKANDI